MMGVNCMNDPRGTVQLLQGLPGKYPLAAYPNAGAPKYQGGRFVYRTTPDFFAESTSEMVAHGARLLGGCCGTTPAHIAALVAAAKQLGAHRG
jgi:homocysteine S-methyltransferase